MGNEQKASPQHPPRRPPQHAEWPVGEHTSALPAQDSDGAAMLFPETPWGAHLTSDPPYTCVRPPLGAGVTGARQGWGGEGRAGPRAQAPVSREAGSQEPIPGRWGEADCARSEALNLNTHAPLSHQTSLTEHKFKDKVRLSLG